MKTLREQFTTQCDRARAASLDQRAAVSVVLRKYPGGPAMVSVVGSAITWSAVYLWSEKDGLRWRVLRVYQGGREVSRPHRNSPLP